MGKIVYKNTQRRYADTLHEIVHIFIHDAAFPIVFYYYISNFDNAFLLFFLNFGFGLYSFSFELFSIAREFEIEQF